MVGVVGVDGWWLVVVGEWFATTDVATLVGVVMVGVVVSVEVEEWFAAVGVLVGERLGGWALR